MKMSSCPHSEKILDYRLGLLDRVEKGRFEAHLESCPVCQKELQIESAIDQELSEELKPGAIEHLVIARLRLLKLTEPATSVYEIIKMGIYAAAFITCGLIVLPLILNFPYTRYLDLNLDLNLLPQVGHYLNAFITSHLLIIGIVGGLFSISSTIYSLGIIKE